MVDGIKKKKNLLYHKNTYKQNNSRLPACSLNYEKLKSPCYSLI